MPSDCMPALGQKLAEQNGHHCSRFCEYHGPKSVQRIMKQSFKRGKTPVASECLTAGWERKRRKHRPQLTEAKERTEALEFAVFTNETCNVPALQELGDKRADCGFGLRCQCRVAECSGASNGIAQHRASTLRRIQWNRLWRQL